MLFKEIVIVYSENGMKPIVHCGPIAEFFNVKEYGT
jgi:hypothetical protein